MTNRTGSGRTLTARSATMLSLAAALGLFAFCWPLLLKPDSLLSGAIPYTPLVFALVLPLVLAVVVADLSGNAFDVKALAMLGVLTAVAAVLRPISAGTAGIELMFAVLILGGRVFGAGFGFVLGAAAMFTSALLTGGVGPWLPYQMLVAGWVGMSAGALRLLPWGTVRRGEAGTAALLLLAGCGFVWGLLYGALTNLYFWPYAVGPESQSFVAGLGLRSALTRFGAFYVATSLAWDLARAVGNAVLILAIGRPTVRALSRFRDRFHYQRVEVVGDA